jgi:voltage-dependent calcium channel L type alpha-1C/voltage-dependent calcium channel L type alpha-1D
MEWAFKSADPKNSGHIDLYGIQQCFKKLRYTFDLPGLKEAMDEFDKDAVGEIDLVQFKRLVKFVGDGRKVQRNEERNEDKGNQFAKVQKSPKFAVGVRFQLPNDELKAVENMGLHDNSKKLCNGIRRLCGCSKAMRQQHHKSAVEQALQNMDGAKKRDWLMEEAVLKIQSAWRGKIARRYMSIVQHKFGEVEESKYIGGKWVYKTVMGKARQCEGCKVKKIERVSSYGLPSENKVRWCSDCATKHTGAINIPVGKGVPAYMFEKELSACTEPFKHESGFRGKVFDIVHNKMFDNFILLCIVATSVFMVIQIEQKGTEDESDMIWVVVDCTSSFIFLVEMILKMIAIGFVGKKPTGYFMSAWNWLDFIIVIEGVVALLIIAASGEESNSVLKSMRVIRTLRPLRAVNRLPELKVIVNSMVAAIPILRDALSVCAFLLFIFAIAAVQWFGGKFHNRCVNPSTGVVESSLYQDAKFELCSIGGGECPVVQVSMINGTILSHIDAVMESVALECRADMGDNPNGGVTAFDNVGLASLTVFQCISLEGWVEIMQYTQDAASEYSWIYFVALIFTGAFVLVNLLMAVIVMKFSEEKERYDEEKKSTFSQKMEKAKSVWMQAHLDGGTNIFHKDPLDDVQKVIYGKEVDAELEAEKNYQGHHECTALWAHKLVSPYMLDEDGEVVPSLTNLKFEKFMSIMVTINILFLAADHYSDDQSQRTTISDIQYWNNFIFTIIFAIEMIIKFLGLGLVSSVYICHDEKGRLTSDYDFDPETAKRECNILNVVDIAVVAIGVLDMVATESSGLAAFRAMRFVRLIKLAKNMDSMQEIFHVLKAAWKSVVYVMLLLMLFVFIFTVAGMQFFGAGKMRATDGQVSRNNYDTFYWAFISTFQVLAGENWPQVLYSAVAGTNWGVAISYYVLWVIVGQFCVLNLFLAVVMGFFEAEEKEHNFQAAVSEDQEMKQYFREFDVNGDEMLDKTEVATLARVLGHTGADDPMALDRLFALVDKDQSGTIDENEFILLWDNLNGGAPPPKLAPPPPAAINLGFGGCGIPVGGWLQNGCYRMLNKTFDWMGTGNSAPMPLFELVMFAIIVLSSAALAVDAPSNSDAVVNALWAVDIATTVIFTLEMTIKCVALGFVMHKNAYLRDVYNVIDFAVVVVSILSLILIDKDSSGPQAAIARLFRALRPLRMISQAETMQMIVAAMLGSIASIANVVVVVFFTFLLFALLGVSFFMGKLYRCNDPDFAPGAYRYDPVDPCTSDRNFTLNGIVMPREWVNSDMNFDHIGYSFVSLFVFASGEGWPDTMFETCDIVGINYQPRLNANPWAATFFIAYVAIAVFFVMELFTGAIFEHFLRKKRSADQSRKGFLISPEQKKWVTAGKILARTPPLMQTRPRQTTIPILRKLVPAIFRLVVSDAFFAFVVTAISLNTIIMAMAYYGPPTWYEDLLLAVNEIFVWAFAAEMCLRIVGLGVRGYFADNWNKFDFVVVAGSIFDIYAAEKLNLALFRIFRVFRVFRLLQVFPGFKLVFNSLMGVIPLMANVGTLVFILFFIGAVIGVSLFGEVPRGAGLTDSINFESWGAAMLLLFSVSTGEDWQKIAFHCAYEGKYGYTSSIVYFVVFVFLSTIVILNIFVMVIAAGMEESQDTEKQTYQGDLRNILASEFQHAWREFDPEGTAWIKLEQLPSMLRFLEQKPMMYRAEQNVIIRAAAAKESQVIGVLTEGTLFEAVEVQDTENRLRMIRGWVSIKSDSGVEKCVRESRSARIAPPEKRKCFCCHDRQVEHLRSGLDKGTLKHRCHLDLDQFMQDESDPQAAARLADLVAKLKCDHHPTHCHFKSVLVGLFTRLTEASVHTNGEEEAVSIGLAFERQQARLRSKLKGQSKRMASWSTSRDVRQLLRSILRVTNFGDIDADNSGQITFEEWHAWHQKRNILSSGRMQKLSETMIREEFDKIDEDNSQTISRQELEQYAAQLPDDDTRFDAEISPEDYGRLRQTIGVVGNI